MPAPTTHVSSHISIGKLGDTIVRTFKGKPLGEHSKRTEKPRRLDRRYERHPVRVAAAIPENSTRLTKISTWLPSLRSHILDERLRIDWATNLYSVASSLVRQVHVASRTTTPGWDYLMAATGVSRSTLKKALAWLRSRGFLGIVASGRKGMYAQKGSDGHELWPSTTGERTNERAVYVLCRPLTEAEKAALESTATATVLVAADGDKLTVDISRPPIPTSVGNNPPHAREGLCEVKNDGATPRQTPKAALSERGQDSCASRPQPLWDIHGTTKAGTKRATRANELVAALTLRDRNFKLRALSGRHLAYLCRPLFAAGYTVWDIEQIIDRKPDGSLHRHDGLDGAKNLANLVAYRFGHWIVNGIPVYSPTQRIMKRREEPLKRAIAAAREAKRVVKPQVTGWSDRAVRIIADIRAMFK